MAGSRLRQACWRGGRLPPSSLGQLSLSLSLSTAPPSLFPLLLALARLHNAAPSLFSSRLQGGVQVVAVKKLRNVSEARRAQFVREVDIMRFVSRDVSGAAGTGRPGPGPGPAEAGLGLAWFSVV